MDGEQDPVAAGDDDVFDRLGELTGRLVWDSSDGWMPAQPAWLHQAIVRRDPADNGTNIGLMVDGLRAAAVDGDVVGEVLAQLSLLRSVDVPSDSAIFRRLWRDVEALGDRHLEALLHIARARGMIFHAEAPEAVLDELRHAVDAAEAVRDSFIDAVVGDVVGTYAMILGARGAARRAFDFVFRDEPVGSRAWMLGHLNLATVEIANGDLAAARGHAALVAPHLAEAPEPVRNFAEWVQILSADRLEILEGTRLTDLESLVVRKRAMRRFQTSDLVGIAPVEECIAEIVAGLPTDPTTGLTSLSTLRSLIDETVAIGRPAQLASVGLPQLLNAAGRLDAREARQLVERVVRRFDEIREAGVLVARVDLDRYAVFGDLDPSAFDDHIDGLLGRLREPLPLGSLRDDLRLEPLARTTVGVARDTGYSLWERVFSVPRSSLRSRGRVQVAVPDSTSRDRGYLLVQQLLSDELPSFAHVGFQPIVDARRRKVVGFESLLRWQSPTLGRLSPVAVVEAAEQCGAIVRLERHIVSESVAGAGRLRSLDESCRLNLNLTGAQLADTAMVEHLIAACAASDVPADAVGVELTESALINHEASAEALGVLAEHGFSTVLDDFGTGYSNLAYLVAMRNAGMKIDGSFVRSLLDDDRALAVCRMLIGAARSLGMTIVAEQVETGDHARRLVELGCPLHQGYRYAPALDLATAMQTIAEPAVTWAWPDLASSGTTSS